MLPPTWKGYLPHQFGYNLRAIYTEQAKLAGFEVMNFEYSILLYLNNRSVTVSEVAKALDMKECELQRIGGGVSVKVG